VTVVHGDTSTAQHVATSHVPVVQTVASACSTHPLGQVKLSHVGAGVVVIVVTVLQHRCELHSGPCALPQKMSAAFVTEGAGQAKLVQVLGAAVVQGLDGSALGGADVGSAVVGSAGTAVAVAVVGTSVVGASVTGASVVATSVAGASVAGASVAVDTVVGPSVAGASVEGASVTGACVVAPKVE